MSLARLSVRRVPLAHKARRSAPFWRTLCTSSVEIKDPYIVLGLQPAASANAVKLAYYHHAIASNPHKNSTTDTMERFNEVGQAYSTILGEPYTPESRSVVPNAAPSSEAPLVTAPFARAFPPWMYRWSEYLDRVGQRFDLWLIKSWSSTIYHHVRAGELAQARDQPLAHALGSSNATIHPPRRPLTCVFNLTTHPPHRPL